MDQLLDIRREVERIRAAVDAIEVRGSENRTLATYAFDKCSTTIDMINRLYKNGMEVTNDESNDQ